GAHLETLPLASIASVRVAFERDERKLGWGAALVIVALLLLGISAPLAAFAGGAAAELAAGGTQGVGRALQGFFRVVGALAEAKGQLKRIGAEVSPRLEMTEICDRVLHAGGPALLFERPAGHDIPVLANLFGSVARVAAAMGLERPGELRELGKLLAYLKEPE